jgi:hypothetical protein
MPSSFGSRAGFLRVGSGRGIALACVRRLITRGDKFRFSIRHHPGLADRADASAPQWILTSRGKSGVDAGHDQADAGPMRPMVRIAAPSQISARSWLARCVSRPMTLRKSPPASGSRPAGRFAVRLSAPTNTAIVGSTGSTPLVGLSARQNTPAPSGDTWIPAPLGGCLVTTTPGPHGGLLPRSETHA